MAVAVARPAHTRARTSTGPTAPAPSDAPTSTAPASTSVSSASFASSRRGSFPIRASMAFAHAWELQARTLPKRLMSAQYPLFCALIISPVIDLAAAPNGGSSRVCHRGADHVRDRRPSRNCRRGSLSACACDASCSSLARPESSYCSLATRVQQHSWREVPQCGGTGGFEPDRPGSVEAFDELLDLFLLLQQGKHVVRSFVAEIRGRGEPVGLEYTIVGGDLRLAVAAWSCQAAIWYSWVSPPRTCFRRIRCSARLIFGGRV
jgi:hypothetical protein